MRTMLSVLTLVLICATADAGWLRDRRFNRNAATTTTVSQSNTATYAPATGTVTNSTTTTVTVTDASVGDGLDEVNAKRAARGLRPFVRCPLLTEAAMKCAAARAEAGLFGHTQNDFHYQPAGAGATAAGCAAYPANYGWMSCCTYDSHTYGGAYWVTGRDGRRYMHLFVR